jgi:hypothetical protein
MSFKFNISEILTGFELSERERSNLARLFDYTNFLYDDETNLTKTFNLVKGAREKLMERISEMFESDLFEDESIEAEEEFMEEKGQ